jgi:hypothetical protein
VTDESTYTTPDEWEDEVWEAGEDRTEAARHRGRNADESTVAAAKTRWERFYGAHKDGENLDLHAIGRSWVAEERMAALDSAQDPEERAALAERVVEGARRRHDDEDATKSDASDLELQRRRSSTYARNDSTARGLRDDFGSGEVSIVLGPTGNRPGRPHLGTKDPDRARELIVERAGGIPLDTLAAAAGRTGPPSDESRQHHALVVRIVAELRRERRATPEALAAALGVSARTIRRWASQAQPS